MKLRLIMLAVGYVELTERQYLHPIATAPIHITTAATIITTSTTTIATKAKAATINSTATTTTATTITAGTAATTATKARCIEAKKLRNNKTLLNSNRTHYMHTGCQEDASAMLQERLMILS